MQEKLKRCSWCGNDELYTEYHDNEWGSPLHDDDKLLEFLILESFQAGLSWITILRKRESFRIAFDNFDANIISKYDEEKVDLLLQDSGIIRNRGKILAAINNARLYLEIQKSHTSFENYIWQFVNHKPIINSWKNSSEVSAITEEAIAMSKQLKKDGFKFVGPTICYAYMQATGMVNDHVTDCFRHDELIS